MDYEQKYKEALERAKGVIEQNPLMEYLKKGIEYILPELKESEDERIRKALIRFHKSTIDVDGIKGEDIIAWLEKQGNLVKYYEDKLDKCACDNFNKGYKKALEKQGEKKPADKVELNPAWSKEDTFIISKILYICNFYEKSYEHTSFVIESIKEDVNKIDNWLKSLKDRYTWKPSDEQMKAFEHFVKSIGESGYASPYENNTKLLYSLLEQLKKLK